MKYLKTYENFEGSQKPEPADSKQTPQEITAEVAEIVKMATGKTVTAQQIEDEVEQAAEVAPEKNESVMDMFNYLVDLAGQTQHSVETGTTPTLAAFGAWLALGVSGLAAAGVAWLSGLGLKKLGSKILGMFNKNGKEITIDFEKETGDYKKEKGIADEELNPSTEIGKKHLAEILKRIEAKYK